jgi:hypothetical protein
MNLSPLNSSDHSAPPFPHRWTGDLLDRVQTSAPVAANEGTGKADNADLSKISAVVNKPTGTLEKSAIEKPVAVMKKAKTEKAQEKPPVKKRRARKKWKKPKDKPNRPLSAYNLFFQQERAAMVGDSSSNKNTAGDGNNSVDEALSDQSNSSSNNNNKRRIHRKTHGKIGFADMARSIGAKWKTLASSDKQVFEKQAAKEKERYATELAVWKEQQKLKQEQQQQQESSQSAKHSESDHAENAAADSSTVKNQMMTDGVSRQRLSLFQDTAAAPDLSTIGYLRALHGRQQFGDAELYPNAAEASANAILQQYQGMISHQHPTPAGPGQFNPFLFSSGTGFAGNAPMSLAEQLQMNTAAQRQMQLERFQMQQMILQNHLASQQQQQQQSASAPASLEAIQQQLYQQYPPNTGTGRGFPPHQQQHP